MDSLKKIYETPLLFDGFDVKIAETSLIDFKEYMKQTAPLKNTRPKFSRGVTKFSDCFASKNLDTAGRSLLAIKLPGEWRIL